MEQGRFSEAMTALQKGHELGSRRPHWQIPSAAWVKECQRLVALEKRLGAVLDGDKSNPAEQLALADQCMRYKQRYRSAVRLYAQAFAAEPKLAENRAEHDRYNAAFAACLAAAGKGKDVDKLNDQERAKLRGQALEWLRADWTAWNKELQRDPTSAVTIQELLKHWQTDADLASVREDKELVRLSKDEQTPWRTLWADVEQLRKTARGSYKETSFKGTLTAKEREQIHEVKLTAGRTYVIDMTSPQFDTYLRLEDAKKKVLAENDDIAPDNLNSRIVFKPMEDDVYRIVATSFGGGSGAYTLVIREFAAKKK